MKGQALSKYFYSNAWAIESGYVSVMESALQSYIAGDVVELSDESTAGYDVIDGVAVLSYEGSFHKKLSGLNAASGGISGTQMISDLAKASADDSIKGIVLSLDTPGGTVDGVTDVTDAIKSAKSTKPVVTFANGLLASAGVWIGATSDAIVAGDTTQIGSIGVIMVHQEQAAAEELAGIKSTVLSAGKYKGDGNRHEPLSDQAKNKLQSSLDYYYSMFVDHVAESRGVSVADCLANMAEARMFIGSQAMGAGLVDKIGNLETAINLTLTLGGYNVKKELQEALSTMDSKELLSCLTDANLPEAVRSSIDESLAVEAEVTVKVSEYDALVASAADAIETIETLKSSLAEVTSDAVELQSQLDELSASTDEDSARTKLVAQFTESGYEASDEFIESLLAMEDPTIVVESTLALHNAKESLADGLSESTGLSDANDPITPETIDEAVAAVRHLDPKLDIDAAIAEASKTYPGIFKY